MDDAAIVCCGLRKTYPQGVEAVRGLDLTVPRGSCFGLLGPNGAGKTTTVEILEGLLEKTSGEVEVLGRRWEDSAREIRGRIGVSLQETRLAEKLQVLETLRLFRSFYRSGLEPAEAMELVGLSEKAKERVGRLSGGQRQRLAVATAMVGNPELLFLDEPTTGLDPQARRQLWDVLRAFRTEGRTIVLTTHYMDEAERLCDEIAIVDRGQRIALGTPKSLIGSVGGDHVIEVDFHSADMSDRAEALAKGWPQVQSAHRSGTTLEWNVRSLTETLPDVLRRLEEAGLTLAELRTRQASLEDVFVKLTGRHLREESAVPHL